ncbi:MAG: hydrogenase maturation nickel metallochaperone HypA [Desulfobacterales bacterium]|nr:hydrogenase maturation nickel metallochaperone HypA [Desulfobacterales bacterium]
MHELPVTESILNIILKHAEKNRVSRVVSVTLHIGELSDLENQWVQHYFDYLSKDTPAAGAVLKIERIPITLKCRNCQHTIKIRKEEMDGLSCPECGTEGDFSFLSGREYYIKEMEAM